MEISSKKKSHMSFETQFKIEFFTTFTGGKKCLEFPCMKEAYVKSSNDLLANYRIDNPDNKDDIWK